MKIITLLFLCVLCAGLSAQDSKLDSKPKVADLAWMTGCWEKTGKEVGLFTSETWTKPFGTMIGTNRTVRKGSVVAYEYLRIETREDGIYFVAHPSGADGETGFRLISMTDNRVVFENMEHDFPKRIIYSGENGEELNARVEDETKTISFAFKKVSCDQ